jgi:hypothetical protein
MTDRTAVDETPMPICVWRFWLCVSLWAIQAQHRAFEPHRGDP